ncbi:MAG: hypothetical protein JXA10_19065 [Anaerolineae bacterium]|nr:hypothetical protein [Anaerolineae bacterium]
MSGISIHQVATICIWFGLGALLYLMALIARFYERLSGQRTYYRLFAVPVATLALATIIMTRQDIVAGDVVADLLLLASGLSLGALCVHVYRLMTSGR